MDNESIAHDILMLCRDKSWPRYMAGVPLSRLQASRHRLRIGITLCHTWWDIRNESVRLFKRARTLQVWPGMSAPEIL